MAGDTGLGGSGVVKGTDKPIGGDVTNLAGFRSGNVCCALSSCNAAIVTTLTATQHLRVID